MVGTLQRRLVPVLKQAGMRNGQESQGIMDSHVSYWNESLNGRLFSGNSRSEFGRPAAKPKNRPVLH